MAFAAELTLNITSSQLVISPAKPRTLGNPPIFRAGEVSEVKVCFVRDRPTGVGAVSIVPTTGVALRIYVGPLGDPFTSAVSAPAVNDVYTLTIPFNIPDVEVFLDGEDKRQTQMEFELQSSTGTQTYQADVIIGRRVGAASFVDPALPEVSLGLIGARAIFVPQEGLAGGAFILTSEDGSVQLRIYAGNDGELKVDNVTP